MRYDFEVTRPGQGVATTIRGRDLAGALLIVASFRGRRRELSDGVLLRALVAYPLLTLKVVVAIHWEALKLLAKGVRLRPRPSPPASTVTVSSLQVPPVVGVGVHQNINQLA